MLVSTFALLGGPITLREIPRPKTSVDVNRVTNHRLVNMLSSTPSSAKCCRSDGQCRRSSLSSEKKHRSSRSNPWHHNPCRHIINKRRQQSIAGSVELITSDGSFKLSTRHEKHGLVSSLACPNIPFLSDDRNLPKRTNRGTVQFVFSNTPFLLPANPHT